jgi:arginase
VPRIHLHVDLDVLDPSEAQVNAFAAPGGLTVAEVVEVVEAVGRRVEIAAASFTAYDPDQDPEDRAVRAAFAIAGAIAAAAAR